MKLICAMIVRDVEKVILFTLKSCIDIVDKFYICDTGSNDKTISIIKDFFKDKEDKLFLFEEKWIDDFSHSRNQVLDKIDEHEQSDDVYILSLDANDQVINETNLIEHLKKNPDQDIYWLQHEWDDVRGKISYLSTRLFKRNPQFRYVGRIHEYMKLKEETEENKLKTTDQIIDNCVIYQNRTIDVTDLNEHTTSPRLFRDYKILSEEIKKDEKDSRSLFYLAQTCYFMNNYKEAKIYYEKRMQMNDAKNKDETYHSILKFAICCYRLKEPWETIESYLWMAHQYIFNLQQKNPKNQIMDIEPLMIIASEYYAKGLFKLAYQYAEGAIEIQMPLKTLPVDSSIYNFKRWLILAKCAEKMNENQIGFNACNNALLSNEAKSVQNLLLKSKLEPDEKVLVDNIEDLNTLRKYFRTNLDNSYFKLSEDKPLFVLFGGSSYRKWNGNSIKTGVGLGGAETSGVKIAEEMVKLGYKVMVFADTDERVTINDVEYMKLTDYEGFIKTHHIDVLVVLRFSQAIKYGYNIKSVYLWLQDIDFIGDKFQYHDSLKGIITLCNTHAEYFRKKHLPESLYHIVKVIGNGVDLDRFHDLNEKRKIKNRFIYSSCPTRGLEYLLEIWNDIKKIIPDAKLHIYSDFDNNYAQKFESIQKLGKEIKTKKYTERDIVYCGRVDQNKLAKEIMLSEYWLYPTAFPETYCITALEMMAGGVTPICSDYWALSEIIGKERGYMLKNFKYLIKEDEKEEVSVQDKKMFNDEIMSVLEKLKELKEKGDIKNKKENAYKFAKQQSWEKIALKWHSLVR